MPLNTDVAVSIDGTNVVRNRAVTYHVPLESGTTTFDRIDNLGSRLPPSGVERKYTDRFDDPTYY